MLNRQSFAYSRNDFIEKIYDFLSGALGEHYKIVVGQLTGQTLYVGHWEYEVNAHLSKVVGVLIHPTKAKFNRMNALETSLDMLAVADMSFRKWAIHHLQGEKYKFKVPKSVRPDLPEFEEASRRFFEQVRSEARSVLG